MARIDMHKTDVHDILNDIDIRNTDIYDMQNDMIIIYISSVFDIIQFI